MQASIVKSLLVGVVLGFMTAFGPGCGSLTTTPPKSCNASNCTTCCDSSGTCVVNTLQTQCGFAGQACVACGINDECFGGSCTPIYRARPEPVDSGTVVPFDAGAPPACAMSCAGCCTPEGVCRTGSSTLECGSSGGLCARCIFPQACMSGACTGEIPDAGGPMTVDAGPTPFCGACTVNSQCGSKTFCLGPDAVGFCGRDCSSGQACPTNTVCANIRDNLGTTVIGQNCVPASGRTCSTLNDPAADAGRVDAGSGAGGGTGGGFGGGTGGGFGGGTGGGGGSIAGDSCANPLDLVLTSPTTVSYSTAGAATGQFYGGAQCGASEGLGPDMVFKLVLTSPELISFTVGGCETGGLVVTLTQSCEGTSGDLICVKAVEGSATIAPSATLPPGTYYVKVDTNSSQLCGFTITPGTP